MLLAAVVVYLHTAAAEGLPTARRWAVIILGGSAVFEWIGARTGFPFGPYVYTDHFGWRMGGVLPVAIPLAWLVILLCGRCLVAAAASRPRPAWNWRSGVAVAAVLTDVNLEYVAWKVRGYWLWYPQAARARAPGWPPLQNYARVVRAELRAGVRAAAELRAALPRRPPARPILVLALMNALFRACVRVVALAAASKRR